MKYQKLEIIKYLKSNSGLSNEDKWLLMKFRTRMSEMKNNFKNRYENHLCQLCQAENDDQIHLFECEVLMNKCEDLDQNTTIEYEDIFSSSLINQVDAIRLINKIWGKKRKINKHRRLKRFSAEC